jgi:Bacterial SH3 domain
MMNQFFSGLIGYCTAALFFAAYMLGDGDSSVFYQSRLESIKHQYVELGAVRAESDRVQQVLDDVARVEASNIVAISADVGAVESKPTLPQIKVETGLVTGSSVNLREGPSTNYGRVGAVSEGEVLVLTGLVNGDWIEVQHPTNGGKAWMYGAYLERQ